MSDTKPSLPTDLQILVACLNRKFSPIETREMMTPDHIFASCGREVIRRIEELWKTGMVYVSGHARYAVPSKLAFKTYPELRYLENDLQHNCEHEYVGVNDVTE